MKRGPKQVLSATERRYVGMYCENLWQSMIEQNKAVAYEQQAFLVDVRKNQSELQAVPLSARKSLVWKTAYQAASEEIDEIFEVNEHRAPLRVRRPYRAHAAIKKAAVDWCKKQFRKSITVNLAGDCWRDWQVLEQQLNRDLSDYKYDPNN